MDSIFESASIQKVFNETKGVVIEMNQGVDYCSITINVGHTNKRKVNFTCKRNAYDVISQNVKISDSVSIRFFPISNFKYNRWYTSNNILEVIKL